jgi:hypothetical protein
MKYILYEIDVDKQAVISKQYFISVWAAVYQSVKRLWGPPSLLYNGVTGLLPGDKATGA